MPCPLEYIDMRQIIFKLVSFKKRCVVNTTLFILLFTAYFSKRFGAWRCQCPYNQQLSVPHQLAIPCMLSTILPIALIFAIAIVHKPHQLLNRVNNGHSQQ